MKNTLADLNNHLFEQLERLNDDDLTTEEIEQELVRTRAMTTVSKQILNNANLLFNAKKYVNEYGKNAGELPEVLKIGEKKK